MKNQPSARFSWPKFTRYYGLSDFPSAMFLIEAECFTPPADKTTNTESKAKGIILVLGMIVTLIVLSVFQLYRSLEVTPANPEIAKSRELSALDTEATVIPKRKFPSLPSQQRRVSSTDKIEILMLKNALAQGRF